MPEEATDLAFVAPARSCSCGGRIEWEFTRSGEERWLGLCGCGAIVLFLPDRPDEVVPDPLSLYLLGHSELPEQRPPWVRLVHTSRGFPFLFRWTHPPASCEACGCHTVLAGQGYPHEPTCAICLACGFASLTYPCGRLTGTDWSPPCPVIARIRRLAFQVRGVA